MPGCSLGKGWDARSGNPVALVFDAMMRGIGLIVALLATACSPAEKEAPAHPGRPTGTLIIGNKGEDSVSFVDLETGRELGRQETGPNPHEVALSPDGRQVAVVSYGGSSIDVFDVSTRAPVRRIDLGANTAPHGIVWLADGRIVATTEGSDAVVLVSPDLQSVSAVSTGQEGSHMVAVAPAAERAYVANMGSKSVTVIDLRAGTKLRDIPVGNQPEGIALTPDGRQLWVADREGDTGVCVRHDEHGRAWAGACRQNADQGGDQSGWPDCGDIQLRRRRSDDD
jgi:YVTN family beta-propeller protein